MQHEYTPAYKCLDDFKMASLWDEISKSEIFENTEWSHVKVRGTGIIIAYLGDDSVDLVDGQRLTARKYHASFLEICERVLGEQRQKNPLVLPVS